MKEIKVQQDVLALAQNPNRVRFGRLNDGRMGVTIDGFAVYIIYSGNLLLDTTAYFNEKLFKYFDSKKKLTYSYHKTKLFVFENGELVGLVLETIVKK